MADENKPIMVPCPAFDWSFFVHNMRNSIGVASVSLDSALKAAPELREKHLQLANAAVRNAVADLESFNEISRPLEMTPRAEDLSALARDVVCGHPVGAGSVPMGTDLADGLVATLDAKLMRRALTAVLDNCQEALAEAGASSAISVAARRDPSGRAVLSVSMTGRSASDDRFGGLGAPFFTRKANKRGLGLAWTQRIVQAHGGTVEFRTPAEGGFAVVMSLPLENAGRQGAA